MPNISEILAQAIILLSSARIPEPRREAQSLLGFVLAKDRTFLIAHPEYQLSTAETDSFDSIIGRRAAREPFHQITGVKEFYGLDFLISPDVLIPRPETEMLVGKSIEILTAQKDPTFCEVGIGSGCIAVSILHNVQAAYAVAVDISEKALAIAGTNSTTHGVSDRLDLVRSDGFANLNDSEFDLIVSNPPYIPAADIAGLEPEVKDFEPLLALTDGGNGLSIIERLVQQSPNFLKSGGRLLVEIGIGQAEHVSRMFSPDTWVSVEISPDFQMIPRMVYAVLV